MKTLRKHLLIGIATIGLGLGSVAAHAQMPGGEDGMHGGPGMHGQRDPAKFQERMEKRRAELHDKLKLNASQEAAWQTYMGKMKPATPPERPSRDELAKMSAPERMERMLTMMKQGEQRMSERLAATKEFYAKLTPEQQKIFNDETLPRGDGHHHRRQR